MKKDYKEEVCPLCCITTNIPHPECKACKGEGKIIKHQLSETRYHPDTLEPVEKPEDWASYSIKIGLTVETRDEIKFNQMWDDWNNALTLEQVFERYKEIKTILDECYNFIKPYDDGGCQASNIIDMINNIKK